MCSLKNNCIRSCLIEHQSFLDSKINIDPKCRVLMSLPCFVHVSCETWYREVNIFWVFVSFISSHFVAKLYTHFFVIRGSSALFPWSHGRSCLWTTCSNDGLKICGRLESPKNLAQRRNLRLTALHPSVAWSAPGRSAFSQCLGTSWNAYECHVTLSIVRISVDRRGIISTRLSHDSGHSSGFPCLPKDQRNSALSSGRIWPFSRIAVASSSARLLHHDSASFRHRFAIKIELAGLPAAHWRPTSLRRGDATEELFAPWATWPHNVARPLGFRIYIDAAMQDRPSTQVSPSMALRFNDLAEVTRQRLLAVWGPHVVPTSRFAVSIVWTAARTLAVGCAAFGGVRGWHGGPAPLDRWGLCAGRDLHHSAPCAAPHLIVNVVNLKSRSKLLIVTSVGQRCCVLLVRAGGALEFRGRV